MRAPALQLDLPDDAETGRRPWFVLLAATAGLVFASGHLLATLPGELRQDALSVVRSSGADTVSVDVSGRDLTLAGVLDAGTDMDRLVQRVAGLQGVRTVETDDLHVFDPVADARSRRATFSAALAQLDLSAVTFEPGSATVSAGSEPVLQRLAALLAAEPRFRVRLSGHTDDTGRAEVNLKLSRERARAVADWLTGRGVAGDQVIAQGYGSTQPIGDNATEAGRARNRRIEVRDVD